MAGRSPVFADEEQKLALAELGRSRERGEADRARAVLLTLAGWTSPEIAVAFGVREDTVRPWRGASMAGGVEASDRKSTRLNSSHANISYAVFCLKKKNNNSLKASTLPVAYTSPS